MSTRCQMLWWSSGTSWSPGRARSTAPSPARRRLDSTPSSSRDSSRRPVLLDRRSSCPSPAPRSWSGSLLGGSRRAGASRPAGAAGAGRRPRETREGGQDRGAGPGGEEKASLLVRSRGLCGGPGAQRGPRPQRPTPSDPAGRWSSRPSSSLMEPPPPEGAAAPRWERTAAWRSWLWLLAPRRTRTELRWPGSRGSSRTAGSSMWSGCQALLEPSLWCKIWSFVLISHLKILLNLEKMG